MAYSGALLKRMKPYTDIFETLCNPCTYNCVIFRTLAYLEPKASLKACRTFKMIERLSQNSLFKHFQGYLEIFSNIGGYSATHTDTQLGRRRRPPMPFLNIDKKCPDFGKRSPDCVHLWVKLSIDNVALRISRQAFSKHFSTTSKRY